MSILMDGINNMQALTAQIEALRSMQGQNVEDIDAARLAMEQSFNNMLDALIYSSDDEDDEKKSSDPFSFLTANNQANSLNMLQDNPLALQPQLDISNFMK